MPPSFSITSNLSPSEIPRCLIISAGHEKTGLKPVFDNSAVCYDVVRHEGPDRLLRFACRLPPRLPSRSPSDHSLFECSQDIRITLMPSRVRVPFGFRMKSKRHPHGCLFDLVRHKGLEPLTFAFVVRDSIQLS